MKIDFSFMKAYCQVSPDDVENLYLDWPATDLLQQEKTEQLLRQLQQLYKAHDLLLPASIVGMSICGLIGTQGIITATYQKSVDLSLQHIRVQVGLFNNCTPFVSLKIQTISWKENNSTISEEFKTAIENISRVSGVKSSLIYNQFGARASSLAEAFLQYEKKETVKASFNHWYNALKQDTTWWKNPFVHTPIYIDNPYSPGSKMMIRSSCCMFYRKEDGVKCYNCPTLSNEEREKMRRQLSI